MNDNYVQGLIDTDEVYRFYTSRSWRRKRKEILSGDKYECQTCRKRGKYTKATHVHHVRHLKACPTLAMEECYIDDSGEEQRQLISLCFSCHEEEHPGRVEIRGKEYVTEERWD